MGLVLDTNHPSQGAETISAATASAFYGLADLGPGDFIEFTFTPAQASTAYVGGNFHSLFADASQTGGYWLVDNTFRVYVTGTDAEGLNQPLTWSANQEIRVKMRNDAGVRKVAFSQATTGNGEFTLSQSGPFFNTAQDLGVGSVPGSTNFRFNGAISDVTDESNLASSAVQFSGTASSVSSVIVSATTALAFSASAAVLGVVQAASALQFAGSAISSVSASSNASSSIQFSVSATIPGTGVQIHSFTSAIALFGIVGPTTLTAPGGNPLTGGGTIDPDGRTITPWNPPSLSRFLVHLARPKTATKSVSDNRGNIYSLIDVQDYQPTALWETAVYESASAVGGDGTIVSMPAISEDEETLFAVSLENANVRHAHVTGYSATATTITSPSITTSGPGKIIFGLFGDGPTLPSGNEGVVLNLVPVTPGAILIDSRYKNHGGGWIQGAWFELDVPSAGTYNLTVTQDRAEGGRWYATAYQQNEFVGSDGSSSVVFIATALSVSLIISFAESGLNFVATSNSAAAVITDAVSTIQFVASDLTGVSASSALSFSGTATSLVNAESSASSSVAFSGTATSFVAAESSASAALSFSGTATSLVSAESSASSTLLFSGIGQVLTDDVTSSITFSSTCSASIVVFSSCSSLLSFTTVAEVIGEFPFPSGGFMSDIAKTRHLNITRGSTFVLNHLSRTDDCRARDLTGAQVYLAIRADLKSAPSIKLTSVTPAPVGWRTGIVIDDQTANRGGITVTIIPSDTSPLIALGSDDPWIYDMAVVLSDGTVLREIAQSDINLYPQVTDIP